MSFDSGTISAVAFDYGNTLIPFGREEVREQHEALADALLSHYRDVDIDRLAEIRSADRVRPFSNEYRENDLPELCTNLVRELYGQEPTSIALADLLKARFDSFIASARLPDDVAPILRQLSSEFRLALVSNYPDGDAIRASMERIGILPLFDSVVVSGDVGYCKPHPAPFLEMLRQLGVEPGATLFVGDNWLADIQGAKRLGMKAALVTRHEPIDVFEPQEGDLEPDLVVECLADLSAELRR